MAVWPCPEELVSSPGKRNGASWQTRIGRLVLAATPPSRRASKGLILSAPRPLAIIPDCAKNSLRQSPRPRPGQCFGLAPTEPMTSPRRSPGLVQTNSWRPFRKFRDARRPSGRSGPRPGSTDAPLASPAIAPPPNPSDPVHSSSEALRPRSGRALLARMAAIKAARLLHHGFVEPIAGRGWPW
jgi:hypothetical protein